MAPKDANKNRRTAKEERKKLAAVLRSKSTGLLDLSAERSAVNQKIALNDAEIDAGDLTNEEAKVAEESTESHEDGESDEESDSEVEEFIGDDARKLEALLAKNTALDVFAKKPKKRKRKPKVEEQFEKFDDGFFVRLEEETQKIEEEKKAAKPNPRRTTFVVDDGSSGDQLALDHDHNIQVAVMNDSLSKPLDMPSEELLSYSKLTLKRGLVPTSNNGTTRATWKRSKVASDRNKKVRNKTGQAAINFSSRK